MNKWISEVSSQKPGRPNRITNPQIEVRSSFLHTIPSNEDPITSSTARHPRECGSLTPVRSNYICHALPLSSNTFRELRYLEDVFPLCASDFILWSRQECGLEDSLDHSFGTPALHISIKHVFSHLVSC